MLMRKPMKLSKALAPMLALWLLALPGAAQMAQAPAQPSAARVQAVRAHMEFLAGEALQGRGSGTRDEHIAVSYAAAQMRLMGLEPAGDGGSFIQNITVIRREMAEAPALTVEGTKISWKHGEQFLALQMNTAELSGPLVKLEAENVAEAKLERGAVVLLTGEDDAAVNRAIGAVLGQGAVALFPATAMLRGQWEQRGRRPVRLPAEIGGVAAAGTSGVMALTAEAAEELGQVAEGAQVRIAGQAGEAQKSSTWNAVGRIAGTDPALQEEAVLLSAHIDHLGVRGDAVYFGADDDASGVTAVLELARALAAGERGRRTLLVALYGSEEAGGLGSRYFIQNPPVPLENIVANLQFEMVGRPDPNTPGKLWLTGYERSDLGAKLAETCAPLVADPYPAQNFFMRSDNYQLARRGVVAHTVSSYGLHKDYHQPTDTVEGIDFEHLAWAVESLVEPVRRLLNSDFRPQWVEGGRP
jgi:aminopeptidase YwaD